MKDVTATGCQLREEFHRILLGNYIKEAEKKEFVARVS
jgi:hypothetical protein